MTGSHGRRGRDGVSSPSGSGRAGISARLGRLIRTVRHLRPRQIAYRLIRRGPVPRIFRALTGPPGRRFRRCINTIVYTPAGPVGADGSSSTTGAPAAPADPFTSAPDAPALLTADGTLTVDGVPASPDPLMWTGGSRFRLYRLHSHLFLANGNTDLTAGVALITEYIHTLSAVAPAATSGVAWEPHPLSLRLINWVRFVCRLTAAGRPNPEGFIPALRCQARHLTRHIEYETDGNHLIDNAVALILSGWFLRSDGAGARHDRFGGTLLDRGTRLLRRELPRQLLHDGYHDELSPMYHRLMTERILDVVAVTAGDPHLKDLYRPAVTWAEWMLGALSRDGGPATAVNDSFPGMTPADEDLVRYGKSRVSTMVLQRHGQVLLAPGVTSTGTAGQKDLLTRQRNRPDSATRFYIQKGVFHVFFDADAIGPDHVPGHAHADSLQILLWYNGAPVLVDTGTSTYDPGPRRDYERSTAAHNTVVVNGTDSSEVWGGFRVGRRAGIVSISAQGPAAAGPASTTGPAAPASDTALRDDPASPVSIIAAHDGYRNLGVLHRRHVSVTSGRVSVVDSLVATGTDAATGRVGGAGLLSNRAFWHVAPEVASGVRRISSNRVALAGLVFTFSGATTFYIQETEIAAGFEKRVESVTIVVEFESELETIIEPEY